MAIISTSIINPLVIKLSNKFNLLDYPNHRKQHNNPITRIGGISILFGFSLSLMILWVISLNDKNLIFQFTNLSKISFVSLITVFLIGIYDDIFNLSPFIRLFLQLLISSILWFLGFQINYLDLSIIGNDNIIEIPIFISFLISALWMTGVTNALNWIDGLDGLAASISIISSFSMMIICFSINNIEIGLIFGAISGSNIGFLKDNKYPARLMMGDGGSYFNGFSYSIYSLIAISNNQPSINSLSFLIPFFLIFIPIADMIFVIFKRLVNGFSIFYPDRSHLHHRLLKNGFSIKNTLKIIACLQILLSILVLSVIK